MYLGGSIAFAASAGEPKGAIITIAKGRKIIIVPVTIEISSSGAAMMPRSRWCITIDGRLIRFGHRRSWKVLRVRHHRIAPLITKNRPARPAIPITHSPLSPANR